MLVITDTPLVEKTYTDPESGEVKKYTFNTVGVLDNVYIGVLSYQMPISYISGATMALIHVKGDYTDKLKQVSDKTGDLTIYLYDNYNVGYNYSGQYVLTNILYINGETIGTLNFTGNDGSTFFGEKYFPENTYSQIVYSYKNKLKFEVYERNQLSNGVTTKKLITVVNQNMPINGINHINLSEIAIPFVRDVGGETFQLVITETDYFGNTSEVISRFITFVYGSIPESNYYKYILFNPINGGKMLPTTAEKIYYNKTCIYPFYINFILQDDGIQESGANASIIFRTYSYNIATQRDEVSYNIATQRGLNMVEISKLDGLVNVLNKSFDYMTVQIKYEIGYGTGQFEKSQFTEEFILAGKTKTLFSVDKIMEIEYRELNDRRDFYMIYDNGIGGNSSVLATNYSESIENETISLRSRDVLNNITARSTEVVNITFDQISQDKLKELLGFESDYMFKVNGIYESKKVIRIGADLSLKEYVIRNATYNKSNQDIYNTVNVELFRPMNAGFQQIGSVEFEVKLNTDSGGIINLIDNSYYDPIKKSCKYGDVIGNINKLNGEYLLASEAMYVNTFDDSSSATIQVYKPTPWLSWLYLRFYLGAEMQVQTKIAKIENEVDAYITIFDSNNYGYERNCAKKYLNVKWVFFGECTNKKFNFWTPSLADQEKTGKTTIEVEFSLKNIQNLLITSYGITVQDGLDYNTYEFYDDEYYKKQLVFVKVKNADALIQVFARTSQGIRYGKQVIYRS